MPNQTAKRPEDLAPPINQVVKQDGTTTHRWYTTEEEAQILTTVEDLLARSLSDRSICRAPEVRALGIRASEVPRWLKRVRELWDSEASTVSRESRKEQYRQMLHNQLVLGLTHERVWTDRTTGERRSRSEPIPLLITRSMELLMRMDGVLTPDQEATAPQLQKGVINVLVGAFGTADLSSIKFVPQTQATPVLPEPAQVVDAIADTKEPEAK